MAWCAVWAVVWSLGREVRPGNTGLIMAGLARHRRKPACHYPFASVDARRKAGHDARDAPIMRLHITLLPAIAPLRILLQAERRADP